MKEIRAAGMEPLVTLYHWDLPLWAHKKGGWKNPKIDKEGYDAEAFPKTSMGWVVDGRCLYWTIRQYWERYHLPVMVTENGMAANDAVGSDESMTDVAHRHLHVGYLAGSIHKLVLNDEGIPVLGYQHWSVMDNMEWCEGYGPRFGLIHVDYQTQRRTIKDSGRFYADVIRTNGENLK